MKKLKIRKIEVPVGEDLTKISKHLDRLQKISVSTINWDTFSYKPDVQFAIGYSDSELLIKFWVTEDGVRAVHSESNQSVYQDSCVEFFVTPISDGPYLNFEFNAIGTCLSQKGMDRSSRVFLESEQIETIRRRSSLGKKTFDEKTGMQNWDLTIAIPFMLIFGKTNPDLSGQIIRGNFYKCGDKQAQQHYLSWNPIGTEKPDFHRPEFFGVLEFE